MDGPTAVTGRRGLFGPGCPRRTDPSRVPRASERPWHTAPIFLDNQVMVRKRVGPDGYLCVAIRGETSASKWRNLRRSSYITLAVPLGCWRHA